MLIKTYLAIIFLFLSTSVWGLEPEVQAAKNEGMRLYNIGHSTAALPYLQQAAEAGDVDAMYYMGEAERRQHMLGLTRAAMAWYLQAAEQGDVHAMLQLFRGGACTAGDRCPEGYEDWHHAALAVAQPKAEAGDPNAMLLMFDIYRMFDQSRRAGEWLERAAEAGQPEAQTILGGRILDGRGWYLTNDRRLQAAKQWFRRAAEQGYVPAMERLSRVLGDLEAYDEAWNWIKEGSNNGSYDARLGIAMCYLEPEDDPVYSCEEDVIEGWAVLHAIDIETQGAGQIRGAKRLFRDLLTDDQVKQAEALAEEKWVGREPPLSHFPPRFGY
ncbi:tetratricopeptide repeat protein [Halomonas sp. KM-1]|uniref:tetratricopeptide repeat protein n=1 Tax=Halomonas sp. KM-1 TaxID=590061 RepID=UPI00028883EE|nr:tetratricopeptide repeat protein [Halomonas sp. KM-1]